MAEPAMCENRRRPPMNRGMVPPTATPARPARMCGPDAATIGWRIAGDLELDCNSLPGSIGGRRMRIHSAVGIRPVVCTGIRRASTVRAARARRSGLTWDRGPSGGCPVVDGVARAGPLAVPSRPPCLVGMDVLTIGSSRRALALLGRLAGVRLFGSGASQARSGATWDGWRCGSWPGPSMATAVDGPFSTAVYRTREGPSAGYPATMGCGRPTRRRTVSAGNADSMVREAP